MQSICYSNSSSNQINGENKLNHFIEPSALLCTELLHVDDIEAVDKIHLSNEAAGEYFLNSTELIPKFTSTIPDQAEDDELDIDNTRQVTLLY